jgi:hypothetical protein
VGFLILMVSGVVYASGGPELGLALEKYVASSEGRAMVLRVLGSEANSARIAKAFNVSSLAALGRTPEQRLISVKSKIAANVADQKFVGGVMSLLGVNESTLLSDHTKLSRKNTKSVNGVKKASEQAGAVATTFSDPLLALTETKIRARHIDEKLVTDFDLAITAHPGLLGRGLAEKCGQPVAEGGVSDLAVVNTMKFLISAGKAADAGSNALQAAAEELARDLSVPGKRKVSVEEAKVRICKTYSPSEGCEIPGPDFGPLCGI